MSIAWATFIIVVLLLPGFMFFLGLYSSEKVTRETAPISPLGQLAGVVGVALFLHGSFYLFLDAYAQPKTAGDFLRPIAVDQFIQVLRADSGNPLTPAALQAIDAVFKDNARQILVYFLVIAAAGYAIGAAIGALIVHGPLKTQNLVRKILDIHPWVYELFNNDAAGGLHYTQAHVLSKTEHSGWIVVYQGVVAHCSLKRDGTVNYLVLHRPLSGLLRINSTGISHTDREKVVVGEVQRGQMLLLAGDNIANIYCERVSLPPIPAGQSVKAIANRLRGLPS